MGDGQRECGLTLRFTSPLGEAATVTILLESNNNASNTCYLFYIY